jgi:hypothetical protein
VERSCSRYPTASLGQPYVQETAVRLSGTTNVPCRPSFATGKSFMRVPLPLIALLVVFALLAGRPLQGRAQEFNCQVSVNYQQLTGNDYTFLQGLEERIREYVNQYSWTTDTYQDVERIDCTIQITLEEALSLTSFRGRFIVAMRRPVYGSSVLSTVVQFSDPNLQFDFAPGTSLVHDLNQYHALASVLDFYAYTLLGYDYDTFSELGGTAYFETARRVAERAQGFGAAGWQGAGSGQGRVDLITQILDPRYRLLRLAYFAYHFNGLDHFVLETENARQQVLSVLNTLQALQNDVSRSYALDMFFAAKYTELTALFLDSSSAVQAYNALSVLDPSHLTEYNKLVNEPAP